MLPIDDVLPELMRALASAGSAVLQAPPGAGKTTRVPLALLGAPWLGEARILMLEPRRLAARAAATYMARQHGDALGETIGYRIRHETRVSARTRIEVVTEGVLTRMLLDDPALEGYGIVIFDEFHERSIHADAGLALTLQTRALLRPELRLLVMSATLDTSPVAEVLGGAPIVTSEGRAHPVEVIHLERSTDPRPDAGVVHAIERAFDEHPGDILAFLPGAAEIERVAMMLRNRGIEERARVHTLYSNLAQEEQDAAIAASPDGTRKIVLATSIAETSLTIEGVRVVVDSGLMRIPRFDARTGLTHLVTVRVTRPSAEQRCGRAGRVAPGACYRLWSRAEHEALVGRSMPEILDADLTPLALDLAVWGVRSPEELSWLDAPPAGAFRQARELLHSLEALDDDGAITAHGRALARLPLHPRLAHMLVRARDMGALSLACDLAALVEERPLLRRGAVPADPDVQLRLDVLRAARQRRIPDTAGGSDVDEGAVYRVLRSADALRARMHARTETRAHDGAAAGALLALAYPDRVGMRRAGRHGDFLLRNGRGANVDGGSALAASEFVVAAIADGRGNTSNVELGAALERADMDALFGAQIERTVRVEYDVETATVRARAEERLGAIVLRSVQHGQASTDEIVAAQLAAVAAHGVRILPWTEAALALRARLAFLHAHVPEWPDVSDDVLTATAGEWLAPWLDGRRDTLRRLDVVEALLGRLPWPLRSRLDELAPSHIEVPSGSRVRVDYDDPAAPTLAARLQELFGWTETPRIADGTIPVTIHILSPARRPVQVTRDLRSFWQHGYFEVRKELRGRYPKHFWPDDPLAAPATRRVRPRE